MQSCLLKAEVLPLCRLVRWLSVQEERRMRLGNIYLLLPLPSVLAEHLHINQGQDNLQSHT